MLFFFGFGAPPSLSADDNNNHYTNTSCLNVSRAGDSDDYACQFGFWYYANNATWTCRIEAMDENNSSSFLTATALANELVAFEASPLIDFNSLQPRNTSNMTNLTLINYGNTGINLSVRGYGYLPSGDNLSMVCGSGPLEGNISVNSMRYSPNYTTAYDEMANLSSQSIMIANFTLLQKTNDLQNGSEVNSTYWRIRPDSVGGNCTGNIVVSAQLA